MISALYNALSGMNAASRRLAATAHNVAHYGATGRILENAVSPAASASDAGPFRLFDTVDVSVPTGGVQAVQVERSPGFVPLYAPDSPFANGDGMVGLANVSLETEIVDSIMARTQFMASLRTFGVADSMLGELLDRRI